MRVSLIVATRGRAAELDDLFASLRSQGRDDFEVIVVDQNGDDRLLPVLAASGLAPLHLRSDIHNANHARNLGLAQARGAIVAFPDDDCTLPVGVLDRVVAAFAADPDLAMLTGPAASPEGGLGSGRWRADSGTIDVQNVWTSVIEFNLFLRRDIAVSLGGFDTRLGPGTRFGSAEGNDLVLRAIGAGHVARYDPDLRIVHPDKRLSDVARERAWRYGMGLGRVLRRHAAPWSTRLNFAIRPAGGMALSLLRLRLHAAGYYAATLAGRVAGFVAPGAHDGLPLAPIKHGGVNSPIPPPSFIR